MCAFNESQQRKKNRDSIKTNWTSTVGQSAKLEQPIRAPCPVIKGKLWGCQTHQEPAKQAEQQLRSGPLRLVDRRQQVLDKVLKQGPVVLFTLLTATPGESGDATRFEISDGVGKCRRGRHYTSRV